MFELDEAAYKSLSPGAVKVSLPLDITKKHKHDLPNGRSKKGVPAFDKWFCQIFPKDITYPSWKYLSKTATDIANICRAKASHQKALQGKGSKKIPQFEFRVTEAINCFGMTRPTFLKAIQQLIDIGFLIRIREGGIANGQGITAQYQLSDAWREWKPPSRDHVNITRARSAKKQKPCKGSLTAIGKGSLTAPG